MIVTKLGCWLSVQGRSKEQSKESAKVVRALFCQRNFNPGNFPKSKANQISPSLHKKEVLYQSSDTPKM